MNGSDRIYWRGHRTTRKDRAFILTLEDCIGPVTIYQMIGDAPDSAGVHKGPGAIDYMPLKVTQIEATKASRRIGGADWPRGIWDDMSSHNHVIVIGTGTATPLAKEQVVDYLDRPGGDGLWPLTGDDDHVKYRPKPPVEFSYRAYLRQHRIREAIVTVTGRLGYLRHKLRKLRNKRRPPFKHGG